MWPPGWRKSSPAPSWPTPRRAAATRPMRRSTRCSRSACWSRRATTTCALRSRSARDARVPMLPRGAGSSQCGQTVGAGARHRPQQASEPRGRVRREPRRRSPSSRASCSTQLNALAAQARPVVPGRRQHVGAVHARRHGRQQLVRLALARLRQHGAQRRSRSMRGSRTAPKRGSARSATWTTAPPRVRELVARAARDRRARARRDRARRAEGDAARRRLQHRHLPSAERAAVHARTAASISRTCWSAAKARSRGRAALTLQLAPLPRHRALGVVNFASLHAAMDCDARTSCSSGRRRSSWSTAR